MEEIVDGDCPTRNTRTRNQKSMRQVSETRSRSNDLQDTLDFSTLKAGSKTSSHTPKPTPKSKLPRTPNKSARKKLSGTKPEDYGTKDIRSFLTGGCQDHDKHVGLSVSCVSPISPHSETASTSFVSAADGWEHTYQQAIIGYKAVEFENTISWCESPGDTAVQSITNECVNSVLKEASQGNTIIKRTVKRKINMSKVDKNQLTSQPSEKQTSQEPRTNNTSEVLDSNYVTMNAEQSIHDSDGSNEPIKRNGTEIVNITEPDTSGRKMEPITNDKIFDMFNQIMTEVRVMREERSKDHIFYENCQKQISEQVTAVQTSTKTLKTELAESNKEVKFCKEKITQLAEVLHRQSHVIQELTSKVEFFEKEKLKTNIFIRGITEKQDENCTQLTKNFFKHKMKIVDDVPIRFACRTGNGKNKPILVSLMNPADKAHIYTHVKHLQGQKNELKKPYQVEDHLPNRLKAEQKKTKEHQVEEWKKGERHSGTETRNAVQER